MNIAFHNPTGGMVLRRAMFLPREVVIPGIGELNEEESSFVGRQVEKLTPGEWARYNNAKEDGRLLSALWDPATRRMRLCSDIPMEIEVPPGVDVRMAARALCASITMIQYDSEE